MSVMNPSRRAIREPLITPERLDKLHAWYTRPFTPRAECATVAVVGVVTFLLFVFAAAIGG